MTDDILRVSVEGTAVILTLCDPAHGNALSEGMVQALNAALDDLDFAAQETLIIQAEGKGFCGGLDLGSLDAETDATLIIRLIQIELLLQRVASLPLRTVAHAHGFAFGAGADLLLACDIALATPECRLSFPGRRFGLVLGTGRLAARIGTGPALKAVFAQVPLRADAFPGTPLELCTAADWPERRAEFARPTDTDAATRTQLLARARPSDAGADGDLAALVRSLVVPGLKARLHAYVDEVRQGRPYRK